MLPNPYRSQKHLAYIHVCDFQLNNKVPNELFDSFTKHPNRMLYSGIIYDILVFFGIK